MRLYNYQFRNETNTYTNDAHILIASEQLPHFAPPEPREDSNKSSHAQAKCNEGCIREVPDQVSRYLAAQDPAEKWKYSTALQIVFLCPNLCAE